ncbi:coiled-coil domain-containing protein 43 [Biomphalaria glabrata]|uniref:Coiled-coil domain-containing protein 43 n=1 Tax=Biomphalaria glabrata TaxID=6526 RepID=A0A2C9KHH4_BIOGL|nr:coiled-coil domain-containing protein 43-like [Biomphalaria glabrata]KAI8730713.1 coiled-coil domain-containing protein 43-like [Biomphalaria glabrata]KAI8764667.1 coiled-coil domain-containing protein 43 [Biomphalaria glabrata]
MATSIVKPFDVWLTETLKSASSDLDTDVFVSYIIGVLDTESNDEEREEGIKELLASVVDPDLAAELYASIVQQWEIENKDKKIVAPKEDLGDRLSAMFEKQTLATVQEKKLTKEEADRKAAILAQYGQVSDGEETDPDDQSEEEEHPVSKSSSGGAGKLDSSDFLVRNVNKEEVQRVEREKREKAKEDQEKKKEKDKQDRQAQKQKQQERKEAEKKRTSKGEKRR